MILELTSFIDTKLLVHGGLVFTDNPCGDGTKIYPLAKDTEYLLVQETIEEIKEQIKRGGINGSNN